CSASRIVLPLRPLRATASRSRPPSLNCSPYSVDIHHHQIHKHQGPPPNDHNTQPIRTMPPARLTVLGTTCVFSLACARGADRPPTDSQRADSASRPGIPQVVARCYRSSSSVLLGPRTKSG